MSEKVIAGPIMESSFSSVNIICHNYVSQIFLEVYLEAL